MSYLWPSMINKCKMLYSGKTLRDFLEALPREWISEDLMEALVAKGVHLSPTVCVDNTYQYFSHFGVILIMYLTTSLVHVIKYKHFVVKHFADIKLVTG